MKYSKYNKELDYTYVIGGFAVYEVLSRRPKNVRALLVHKDITKNEQYDSIIAMAKKHGVKIIEASSEIEKISGKGNVYMVCVIDKYVDHIQYDQNTVVLVNPSDSGNLGTIIRVMLGMGYKNLAIIKPCVDYFDPKVIRSSMGSIFSINIETFDSVSEYMNKTKNTPLMFALNGDYLLKNVSVHKNAIDCDCDIKCDDNVKKIQVCEPISLFFGNEAHGLDKETRKLGANITIAHSHDIDSLNLAMSVGIALFYLNTKF